MIESLGEKHQRETDLHVERWNTGYRYGRADGLLGDGHRNKTPWPRHSSEHEGYEIGYGAGLAEVRRQAQEQERDE